jgi:KaiC/GvpD/RAD55 family RecA-like ATPase
MEAKDLVAAVREAARRHHTTWERLVPDALSVDFAHEDAEEAAYVEMAAAKRALRDHICDTYGISARELASLAKP